MAIRPFMIDNRWVEGHGPSFASTNPADGREAARIGGASAVDVDHAVAAARAALAKPEWASLKHHERARFLTRMSELIGANAEQLARVQMMDNGKTIKECRTQVASAAATFRYYAAVCETFESELTTQRGPSVTMTVYEPVGVVAAITPWNSPLTLEAQKLAPILAAGNSVVLKPSELTPQIALEYARIAIEAGLPAGVLNVVTGAGDVGRHLVDHSGTDMISFTGGTAAGRAIAEAAGRRLKPVVLELGGKSPNIVFADADLDAAAKGVAGGIFSSGGQSCIAGSRVFVERAIFDRFLDGLRQQAETYRMGMPESDDTGIGPMASFQHRDFVARAVESGVAEGGRIVTGGKVPTGGIFEKGAYYPATIVTGITNQARICREEIFGPVAAALPFDGEDDLINQANDSDFGLAAGIWTGDYRKAWRVGRAMRAGSVWINTYKEMSISAPFGGFKQSGLGREKGLQGMRIYMEPKSLYWHIG
jgi:acyl-CoA reductase-like NAD-dependent aldehyde dehydrogenase